MSRGNSCRRLLNTDVITGLGMHKICLQRQREFGSTLNTKVHVMGMRHVSRMYGEVCMGMCHVCTARREAVGIS